MQISKTLFGHRALYQMLECVVNRFVRPYKYRGHQAFLNNIKLLSVFTNVFPNITDMGLDRYVGYEIYDKRTNVSEETESTLLDNPMDKAGKQRAYINAIENSSLRITTVLYFRLICDKQLQNKKRTATQSGLSDFADPDDDE